MTPPPTLPPPERAALLLDFDGTLVDIAPTPDLVVVPDSLRDSLTALRDRLGGALAIVTGRPIAQIDHFLPGIPHAVSGEHGAAFRHGPRAELERMTLPEAPEDWLRRAEALVAAHAGTMLERKRAGFVLHYRQAPDAAQALRSGLEAMVAEQPERFHVHPSKMAWELRPAGADKGSAVAAVMARPPFAGRSPIFIGDDVTDQDGIAEAERQGGIGLMVPERFWEPGDVRDWLAGLARDWHA